MRPNLWIAVLLVCSNSIFAQSPPASQPGVGKFPHVEVDVARQQIRIECEALHCEAPLEHFCVGKGGSEHEAVMRTQAKPSHVHTALLMLGLEPGEPVKFSEAARKWFPPHGPPLNLSVEYDKDGKHYAMPAYKLMRDVKNKQAMPAMTWIFAGSRVMPDGNYAADVEKYVVSIVNFDYTLIDVPKLASNANETLEWETNLDLMPALGSPMTLIIEPVNPKPGPSRPGSTTSPSSRLSDVTIDQQLVDRLRQRWDLEVRPHSEPMRQAAQAQYEVLTALRREQQRLIDEADRIQRLIDDLEREYQQMTTPRPEKVSN